MTVLQAPFVKSALLLSTLLVLAQAKDAEPEWRVEQMPGGRTNLRADGGEIVDAAGCTAWYPTRLRAPVSIRFEVTAVSEGGANDRVSDVNCFWMATDPKAPDGCPFGPGHGRSGKFEDYDSLRTYYVGMGGNGNTTTRFRRYAGDGTKPLRPEHDLRLREFLLEPNRTYRIEIAVEADGTTSYRRDGVVFFAWRDPVPLREGWFALRTVRSHLRIAGFRVDQRD